MVPRQALNVLFDAIDQDRPSLSDKWDVLLGVVAEKFQIFCNERLLYAEEMFCVVELAAHLADWLRAGMSQPFSYSSLESDEEGLIRFTPEGEHWRISCLHQLYEETNLFSSIEIKKAASDYIENVHAAVLNRFRIDIKGLLEKQEEWSP